MNGWMMDGWIRWPHPNPHPNKWRWVCPSTPLKPHPWTCLRCVSSLEDQDFSEGVWASHGWMDGWIQRETGWLRHLKSVCNRCLLHGVTISDQILSFWSCGQHQSCCPNVRRPLLDSRGTDTHYMVQRAVIDKTPSKRRPHAKQSSG